MDKYKAGFQRHALEPGPEYTNTPHSPRKQGGAEGLRAGGAATSISTEAGKAEREAEEKEREEQEAARAKAVVENAAADLEGAGVTLSLVRGEVHPLLHDLSTPAKLLQNAMTMPPRSAERRSGGGRRRRQWRGCSGGGWGDGGRRRPGGYRSTSEVCVGR